MMLEIKDLTKRYGKTLAVERLSLAVPEKSVYGLLGPNGAGKSTIINICCGLVRPTSGDVLVCGNSITRNPEQAKARIGVLAQDISFYPERTALDHLTFYGRLSGVTEAQQRAKELLKQVGLETRMNDRAGAYSHGMTKLLNLAQALISDPDILFLDEPFSGLDPLVAHKIKEVVKKESKSRTIILSSHQLDAVEQLCSHVAIIHSGKLLSAGKLSDIMRGASLEKRFIALLKKKEAGMQ